MAEETQEEEKKVTDSTNDTTDEKETPVEEDNFPDDPRDTTPQQQRVLMKRTGYKMQTVGDTWYPISKKWYTSWINYTCFTKADDDVPGGLENLHERDVPRPGAIDNSDLSDEKNEAALKKELEEHLTHEWVHSDKWDLLFSWYGGGPSFPRKVYERGQGYNKEKYICIHPRLLKIISVNSENSTIDENRTEIKGFPQDYSLKSMAQDFEKEIPSETEDEDGKEDDNNKEEPDLPKVHIWARFGAIKDIYPIKKKITVTLEDLKDEDEKRWVEIPDDYLKTRLEDINFGEKEELVIEYQNTDGTWPLAKSEEIWKEFQCGDIIDVLDDQDGWYEGVIRLVGTGDNEGKIAMHYIGWNIKWDEYIDANDSKRLTKRNTNSKGPHRPKRRQQNSGGRNYTGGYSFSYHSHDEGRPQQKGAVGLRNLGNTCFMNSTIQCLAQSPWLTDEYFLNGEYVHHINKKNPLGWKGKVATAWAALLNDMFSDKYRVVAPRQFKEAIGEVAPRFMGYAQQDSQELLSFLLDGLHEDLNQIIDKPSTGSVESNGRKDKVVALESWKTYLKRNQSIVVDLLQGQYKSRVECPDCDRISITFDPYMFLSVPLPTEKYKTVEFTWVDSDTTKPPTVHGLKMNKYADVGMFKDKVARQFDVPKEELFVCDIWKSKIHRELRKKDNIADINRKSDDIFVFHSPRIDPQAENNNDENGNENGNENEQNQEQQANNNAQQPEEPQERPPHDAVDEPPQRPAGGAGDEPAGGAGAGNAGAGDQEEFTDEEQYRQDGGRAPPNQGRNQGGQQGGQQDNKFTTFVIEHNHTVVAKNQYGYSQQRMEEEAIGYPLLVSFCMREPLPMKSIRDRLWLLTKPFVRDDNIDINDNELPFRFYAVWGFNNRREITDNEESFNLRERNMKFIVHWEDAQQYKKEYYPRDNRPRDKSAPAAFDPKGRGNRRGSDDDDDGYGKAITLQQCIDAWTEEETLGQDDAWYCSKCKDFKCAKKKLDLWNSPDLLIVHLKRFSYTRQFRDRINTKVLFPVEDLDLSNYLLDPDAQKDAMYDLYAISNHMGGLGGGHYTAYAKNIYNHKWYHLDDSRASEVGNPEGMVSSAAYVLYYKKKKPRQLKHRASRVFIPETIQNELNSAE